MTYPKSIFEYRNVLEVKAGFFETKPSMFLLFRYDIQDGVMTILNSYQSSEETVFAQPGEFFGEIYFCDYLFMDEVAGNIISRSVETIILRPKTKQTQSNRVYECSIKVKTSQLVVIKLNEELCRDYIFEKDQVMHIDFKFRYNRLPMCEMHQAIDMCQQKTEIFFPDVKNVSNKHKVSNIVSAAIFFSVKRLNEDFSCRQDCMNC